MQLVAVGAVPDDLGGGPAVNGPVELVLHGGEKGLADLGVGIVINAGGVDVGDLLVEKPLGGADVLNPPEQFLKIIEGLVGFFRRSSSDEAFDDDSRILRVQMRRGNSLLTR